MKPSAQLDEVLAELRQEFRSIEAPSSLEAHLVEQTSRSRSSRTTRYLRQWAWGLSLAMTAVCIAGVAYWQLHSALPAPPLPQPAQLQASSPPAQQETASSSADSQTTATKRTRGSISKHDTPATEDISPENFLALPSSEGLPPPSAASLVRLQIQSTALRQYGLDVPPTAPSQMILAEFVVGEDGLPRAIRIIR